MPNFHYEKFDFIIQNEISIKMKCHHARDPWDLFRWNKIKFLDLKICVIFELRESNISLWKQIHAESKVQKSWQVYFELTMEHHSQFCVNDKETI